MAESGETEANQVAESKADLNNVCSSPEVITELDHQQSDESFAPVPTDTEEISAFKGDILYESDGIATIIENSIATKSPESKTEDENAESASSSTQSQTVRFVTMLNFQTHSSVSSEESQEYGSLGSSSQVQPLAVNRRGNPSSAQNFAVHTLAEDVLNANNNNNADTKDSLFRKLVNVATEMEDGAEHTGLKRRPILMCFPCRLTFGGVGSFVSHASSAHYITPTDHERKLLDCKHIGSVIQETVGGKAIICFLEPVKKDQALGDAVAKSENERQLENVTSASTDRPIGFVEASSTANTDRTKKDARHKSNDVKMEDVTHDTKPSNYEEKGANKSETETESRLKGEKDLAGLSEAATESKVSSVVKTSPVDVSSVITSQNNENNLGRRLLQKMATTSGNQRRTSPLSATAKVSSGKSGDCIFSGSGVTSVDPMFQMSIFQSRNSCKTLKCPRCNWHYKYRQTLDAHMKEKHVDETSDCIYCNANQPHPRLSRGESYACGYKPFKCEVCNYSTTTKGNLSIHMQSDKHLYNVKTLQHQHQQNKDKSGGQNQTAVNVDINNATGRAIPARLLAEKQEQYQNYQHQARKQSSPDSSTASDLLRVSPQSRKGGRELSSSTSSNRHQAWRCDVCNYETDSPLKLGFHMQSDKHARNAALAGVAGLRCQQESQLPVKKEINEEYPNPTPSVNSPSLNNNTLQSMTPADQSSPSAMAALYYYLAALQSTMQSKNTSDPQPTTEEREQQQKQILAQQQQIMLAQQYQQMLAQLSASGDASTSTVLLQQQILLQQQLQLWRQLLQRQGEGPPQLPNVLLKPGDLDLQDANSPSSTSNKFLFTCGVCCNFSCNDLESLCAHVRAPRFPKTPMEESEWTTKSPAGGYLCRICNYTTQLKTNFSLHCKTEKHSSKLQLINHIREGGDANEWKVGYAIAGNNMNKVTCNGCRHSATNIDKLRIHCSTDRHQETLTMCHYLDKMLQDADLNKAFKTTEGVAAHHLLCRPCSYQSKFVVEMTQHMQCQNHQAKVHRGQQQGIAMSADIVAVEPDQDEEKMETDEEKNAEVTPDAKDSKEEETDTRPSDASTIVREQEYHGDTMQFKLHLIEVHKMTGQDKTVEVDTPSESSKPANKIEGVMEAIQIPVKQGNDEDFQLSSRESPLKQQKEVPREGISDSEDPFSKQCRRCGDVLTSEEKWQAHSEIHKLEEATPRLSEQAKTSEQDQDASSKELHQHSRIEHQPGGERNIEDHTIAVDKNMEVNISSKETHIERGETGLDAIFSNPGLLLTKLCSDALFAREATKDIRFGQAWDSLPPPYYCSTCEETFVKKADLFDHLSSAPAHKIDDITQNGDNKEPEETKADESVDQQGKQGSSEQTNSSSPPSGVISQDSEPYADGKCDEENAEKGEKQGISKKAHKRALEDVGFDQVAHFVENRSAVNRERAKQWKTEHSQRSKGSPSPHDRRQNLTDDNNNKLSEEELYKTNAADERDNNKDESEPFSLPAGNKPLVAGAEASQFACGRCGKEFSNMWIMKVHENKVHGLAMSQDMLEEFVQGYTQWYWDSFKKESENGKTGDSVSEELPQRCDASSADLISKAPAGDSPTAPQNPDMGDDNGFRQAALQALVKNYPGLLSSYGSVPTQTPPPQPNNDEQSKLQQQQDLLQMLMASQAQSAMQQQQQQQIGQGANASNIMNTLIDQLYGSAMHGAVPGFMDPMAVMGLMQQQSRVSPPGGVNPYQLLAMRYLQQQQQMQQLLMYPAMAASGGAGIPFMPGVAENSNQQQMLAAFAASVLNPGMSQDAASSMMNNPIANAFHAYQMQAAAAVASLPDNRSAGNDPEQDPANILRAHQRDSAANAINQSQQQSAEIPAKRPRTRITDDQLKVLRANFDIITSPSEEQISEMAFKTNLPPKVIKHWFRNTLFKERQRSKDSPYNFNIPPMTSLDDVKDDLTRNGDANREDSGSRNSDHQKEESGTLQHQSGFHSLSEPRRISEHDGNKQNDRHDATGTSRMPTPPQISESHAMRIFQALNDSSNNSADAKRSFFANFVPRASDAEKASATALSHLTDLSRHASAENDSTQLPRYDALSDPSYSFNSRSPQDYPYPSPGSMSAITRRTPRTRFSDYQLKVLQEFFDRNAYPKDEDLDKMSRMLELSTRVIVVWFQNARQKARKSYEMQQGAIGSFHQSNGLPAAISGYVRRRQSPPTSPQQHQHSSNSSSGLNNSLGYSRSAETPVKSEIPSHSASSGFSISIKEEPKSSSDAGDVITRHKCRECDVTLATKEALQQHERLHSPFQASSLMQQFKMHFPSIIEGAMQEASSSRDCHDEKDRDSGGSSSKSSQREGRKSSYDSTGSVTSQSFHTVGGIVSRFGVSQMEGTPIKSEHLIPGMAPNASTILSSQIMSQAESIYGAKRNFSISPTMVSPSMTSPNGGRMVRKGINDTSKDPKRLRTTITPEQLEYLYQQYLIDSSPSRKVIERISQIVGLKKRVVQVWFQNTRARERKGQFRSVGRITLGMPQICPHCAVTFRTKADLDAHVRYRHMQSPSSIVLSSLPQASASASKHPQHPQASAESTHGSRSPVRSGPIYPSPLPISSREESNRSPPKDNKIDYRKILHSFNKRIKEQYLGQSESSLHASAPDPTSSNAGADVDHPSTPKRRKISESDSSTPRPLVTSQSSTKTTTVSSKTAEIYKAVSEQIFGPRPSSVDAIAQRLQIKSALTGSDQRPPQDAISVRQEGSPLSTTSSASEGHESPRRVTSSPESISSSASSFMGPLKRYRTQMTSLQVHSLKHSFAEFKTPTLLECEILGAEIGLPKRVIQVWFQNARAKEKKAKQGDPQQEESESQEKPKSYCSLCPEMRYGSQQEYRNHIFTKLHLQNFMNSCEGIEASDDQNLRSPSSDADEIRPRNGSTASGHHRTDSPSPSSSLDGAENKFRISAFAANDPASENRSDSAQPGWDATAYASLLSSNPSFAQKCQEFAEMRKLMNASSTQNGTDSQAHDSEERGVDFTARNAGWVQQALLRGRMGSD